MNIYQLTGDLVTLQHMLEDGEYSEEELLELTDSIDGEYSDKLEGYCRVIKKFRS